MMTLYSGTTDPFSQRCRIVLHEKGMDFQIIDVDLDHKPEDLAVMNPYNQVPVLVERDLVLHESNIINEYIDERFPHPQLMPADPVMRARARLFLHRFEKELFCHIDALEGNNQKQIEKARNLVRDSLLQIAPVFTKHKYMLGEEYSMLDVAITPLLWRLDYYGVAMPKQAAALMKYAERRRWKVALHDAPRGVEVVDVERNRQSLSYLVCHQTSFNFPTTSATRATPCVAHHCSSSPTIRNVARGSAKVAVPTPTALAPARGSGSGTPG